VEEGKKAANSVGAMVKVFATVEAME